MVASADGRAAVSGSARQLGSPADTEMLLELRALGDALLIGAGTLRAEGYARLLGSPARRARREAAGLAPDPPCVVVSRRLNLPWDAGLFQAPEQPVLIYTTATHGPPPVPAPVEVVRLPNLRLRAVLADLRGRGVRALASEGGPTLLGSLLRDGLVDELFLTIAPVLRGDDTEPPVVAGRPFPSPRALRLLWALHHRGELYLRYAV
jgi:riboflavin biosynthesis pyrimidine reductase